MKECSHNLDQRKLNRLTSLAKRFYPLKDYVQAALLFLLLYLNTSVAVAQNSLTGDGFGGRSWYVSYNYQAGSYGAFTVCGDSNQLYAWGSNVTGELGNNTGVSTRLPVAVPGMKNIRFHTAGYFVAAIKNDNTAWAWGGPYFGGVIKSPQQLLSNVKFADAGMSHIAFVKKDGTVWTAGLNAVGAFGNGVTNNVYNFILTPVQMTGITNAVRVAAIGFDHLGDTTIDSGGTIILLSDGRVKISGGGKWFSNSQNLHPVTVPGLTNIVDIKGSTYAAFALNKGGEVFSFGRDDDPNFPNGILGIEPVPAVYSPPTKINFPAGAAPIVAISANTDGAHAFALDENGNMYGWGTNINGVLGIGSTTNAIMKPVFITSNVIDISAGETFSYIIKSDKTIWATGRSGGNFGPDSSFGSIWMNLHDSIRYAFTKIDPTASPMFLCSPKRFGNVNDTTKPIVPDSSCKLDDKIKIYTSTAGQKLVIDKKITTCKVTMNVYNMIGQLLLKSRIINDGLTEIDIARFPGGVYVCLFFVDGKSQSVKKVLKQ